MEENGYEFVREVDFSDHAAFIEYKKTFSIDKTPFVLFVEFGLSRNENKYYLHFYINDRDTIVKECTLPIKASQISKINSIVDDNLIYFWIRHVLPNYTSCTISFYSQSLKQKMTFGSNIRHSSENLMREVIVTDDLSILSPKKALELVNLRLSSYLL